MTQNSLTILGSSSGMPQVERSCSGYLLIVDNSLSLIDCGSGICSSFLRQGFDPAKLDQIFISHSHSDHCCELSLMIQLLHVQKIEKRLDIYLPDELVTPFENWLNAVYLFPGRIAPQLNIWGYSKGVVHNDGYKLTTHPNNHHRQVAEYVHEHNLPNQMQCFSMTVEVDNRSFFYSADIGALSDIKANLKNLDYAIIETTHVDIDEIIQFARTSSVKQFILTHLGDDEEIDKLKTIIKKSGVQNINIADDGMCLKL